MIAILINTVLSNRDIYIPTLTGNVIKSYKELFTLNAIQLRKYINVIYLFDMLWKKVTLNTIIDKTITFISFLNDVQGNIHNMLK